MTKKLEDALRKAQQAWHPFRDEREQEEARECPPRLEKLRELGVVVETSGGNCPVQIEGRVGDVPFYFRARGAHWSLGIGNDPIGDPEWEYEEPYGEWPEAGWMPLHEAYDFLIEGVNRWNKKIA